MRRSKYIVIHANKVHRNTRFNFIFTLVQGPLRHSDFKLFQIVYSNKRIDRGNVLSIHH